MLQTAIITFREGLEMFLIVAIMLAYLVKTGRTHLREPVYWGIAVAAFISLTTGWHIAELAEDPLMEGGLAIISAILVASMTYTMMRAAGNIRQKINDNLERHATQEGWGAVLGVFGFTVLMIAREGMETAMMLGTMTAEQNQGNVIAGAFLGFAVVGVIAYFWVKQSAKINLRVFMQVTGVFLMMFCAYLFMYGFHELTEVGAIPYIDNFYWHTATEKFEPGEPVGNVINFGLFAVPCLWLFYSQAWDRYVQPRFSFLQTMQ